MFHLISIQLGDPTAEDHISSQYSCLDFDGLSEYTQFFSSMVVITLYHYIISLTVFLHTEYRGCMTRIVQQLSLMMPRTAAKEAITATQGLTMKIYESACKNGETYCIACCL